MLSKIAYFRIVFSLSMTRLSKKRVVVEIIRLPYSYESYELLPSFFQEMCRTKVTPYLILCTYYVLIEYTIWIICDFEVHNKCRRHLYLFIRNVTFSNSRSYNTLLAISLYD